jgi:hypothetical protein
MEPFAPDPPMIRALSCAGTAIAVTLVLAADAAADRDRESRSGTRRGKKRWQK